MARPAASSLNIDPLLLGVLALVIVGWLWVARRGTEPLSGGRRYAFAGAVLLIAAVWFTPLAIVAEHYLLAAHLIQVIVLMGPVPALLLLSLPAHVRIGRMPIPWPFRLGVHPVVAILALNATFIAWHVTPVYDAALANWWLYDVMESSLLLVSLLFWWPIVSPCSTSARNISGFAKLGYIVLATIPQTFGGLLVALAGHVLYTGYGDGPRVLGLDPMTDQQIAGASIALVSKIALLAAFFVIFMHLLNTDNDGREEDGGNGGGGGSNPRVDAPTPRPSGIPRWLEDAGDGRTTDEPVVVPRPIRVPVGSGSRPA